MPRHPAAGGPAQRVVADAGKTSLKPDTRYLWAGVDAKATVWLFPEQTHYNLFAVVEPTYYYDMLSGVDAFQLSTSLNYNLTSSGLSSIALTYTSGRDHTTMKDIDLLTAGLKIKY